MGPRIEECALNLSNNVEIKTVYYDDLVLKKANAKKAFIEKPDS